MKYPKERIRITLEDDLLDAYKAAWVSNCGKAARFPEKTMKLNDEAFICVYATIKEVIVSKKKYLNETGREYKALHKLIELLEKEFCEQRGVKFTYNK